MVDGEWSGWSVGSAFLSMGKHDKVSGKFILRQALLGKTDPIPDEFFSFELKYNTKEALDKMASEYQQKINIHAPLQFMTKAEIINLGLTMDVDYSLTNTCYDPTSTGLACGECDACILRKRGFLELGLEDPIRYNN